jgi:hypothetical protein
MIAKINEIKFLCTVFEKVALTSTLPPLETRLGPAAQGLREPQSGNCPMPSQLHHLLAGKT